MTDEEATKLLILAAEIAGGDVVGIDSEFYPATVRDIMELLIRAFPEVPWVDLAIYLPKSKVGGMMCYDLLVGSIEEAVKHMELKG